MPIGKLITYNVAKGYGFISHSNGDRDIFVHASELLKAGIELSANISLAGLILDYEVALGNNSKKQAINIKVI